MSDETPTRIIPEAPQHRPLERFWPYAELAEQPSDEELARLHPDLRDALFGSPVLPFSISVAFPEFPDEKGARAVALAKASDEYVAFVDQGVAKHRARFFPGRRALDLRDLYTLVWDVHGSEVLIDDQPLPYARELWLPLVWLSIG